MKASLNKDANSLCLEWQVRKEASVPMRMQSGTRTRSGSGWDHCLAKQVAHPPFCTLPPAAVFFPTPPPIAPKFSLLASRALSGAIKQDRRAPPPFYVWPARTTHTRLVELALSSCLCVHASVHKSLEEDAAYLIY